MSIPVTGKKIKIEINSSHGLELSSMYTFQTSLAQETKISGDWVRAWTKYAQMLKSVNIRDKW